MYLIRSRNKQTGTETLTSRPMSREIADMAAEALATEHPENDYTIVPAATVAQAVETPFFLLNPGRTNQ